MKLRWKISAGFVVVVAVGICGAVILSGAGNSAQQAVEETQRALRQQGFKTDLSEFNFSTSDELRAREAALTNAGAFNVPGRRVNNIRRSMLQQAMSDPMQSAGSNTAVPIWKRDKWEPDAGLTDYLRLAGHSEDDLWPALREALDDDRETLDAACAAAISGPIRFHLNASAGNGMLLPHLASFKQLTQVLGKRAVLELHEGKNAAAWTNLLASARMVTAWEPEPAEVSHLTRFACAAIVFNTSWQVLQAGGWSDAQLAQLQHEWETVDFLKGLPETAAFTRACMVATCQLERQQPLGSSGVTPTEMLRSPRQSWAAIQTQRQRVQYREYGTYEDQKALLLHYRDRELELRRAIQSPTWSEMRHLPGVTNRIPFRSKYDSFMLAMMNNKEIMLAVQMYNLPPPGIPRTLLVKAAEAEARRWLIVTAIALERYRGRHGSYPKALNDLAPKLLTNAPVDFMDGQPLRYRLTDDGHFVLYSVGLDGMDDGGQMPRQARRYPRSLADSAPQYVPQTTDLVWPRPASAAEIGAWEEENKRAKEAAELAAQESAVEAEREVALRHARTLAALERLYAQPLPRRGKEPTYRGRSLSRVLRNATASEKTQIALDQLLTVKQVTTGEEPAIATFEVPISYDVVTNLGRLQLLVDADPEGSDSDGGEFQECRRATNGNCLLLWNTAYDPPGKHFLQAQFLWEERDESHEFKGPLFRFNCTNVCQFDPCYSQFDSSGGILYAKLPEANGVYAIELRSPAGELVRTFKGTTSNGVIEVRWDLTDEHGKPYTNTTVDSVFHITLPDSGRSQTQKGP